MSLQVLPNEFFIKQEFSLITNKPRVFNILDIDKNILIKLEEEKKYNFWQLFFKSKKPFNMKLVFNEEKFKFIKRSKFLLDTLGVFDNDNNLIAFIKKSFLNDIRIYNNDEQLLFIIKGSLLKKNFLIEYNDKEFGKITKQFTGILKEVFTDADTFYIKLPESITLNEQMTFIACSIFIDSIYYDD